MANVYEQIRDQFETGDCVLTKGTGLVSRIIRLFTEYSHAYTVIGLGEYKELHDRVFLLEAQITGVRLVLLSDVLRDHPGQIDLFKPKYLTKAQRKVVAVEALCLAAGQIRYDFGSLFRNLLGRTSLTIKRYFCSELVWDLWARAGVVKVDSPSLTLVGADYLLKGKAPRPGDIPKWVCGELFRKVRSK